MRNWDCSPTVERARNDQNQIDVVLFEAPRVFMSGLRANGLSADAIFKPQALHCPSICQCPVVNAAVLVSRVLGLCPDMHSGQHAINFSPQKIAIPTTSRDDLVIQRQLYSKELLDLSSEYVWFIDLFELLSLFHRCLSR